MANRTMTVEQINAEWKKLRDERDRLKAALEQMLREDNGGELSWQEIAEQALNPNAEVRE